MPEPRAKRCKHCEESSHRLDSGSPFWRIQLDQDLLDTISAIYPEWFKDYTNNTRTSISSIISSSPSHQSSNDESTIPTNSSDPIESQGHKSAKVEVKTKSKARKLERSKDRREKRQIREVDRDNLTETEIDKKGSKHQHSGSRYERTPDSSSTTGRKSAGGATEDTSAESQDTTAMAEGNRSSPPKAEVDDSPLQYAMDRNKESLKVKLMLRRPITQLVAQGIMPSPKTPPAFHEQRKQLERAKTGDLLKAKIQRRPGRDELVRQHILEDVGHVDPSLAERQRMLKKARLADQLNDQLSHRPGPLELIQKNILHTEEPIERAVKEGHIPFKATCEGQVTKPQPPDHYITFEDDSQSSEGVPSPPIESRTDVLETAATSAGIVTVSLSIPTTGGAVVVSSSSPVFQQATGTEPTIQTFAELCNSVVGNQQQQLQQHQQQQQQQQKQQQLNQQLVQHQNQQHTSSQASQTNGPGTTLLPLAPAPSPMSLGSTTSSLSPLSNISIASPPAPPPQAITPRPQPSPISVTVCQRSDAPGKDKNRKKSKTKNQPKTRTIKFHEYKGPPNAQKTSVSSTAPGLGSASPGETSYELLLHQQQLFLQWQLEWQHKYPKIILPAAQKPLSLTSSGGSDAGSISGGSANAPSPAPSNSSNNPSEQPPLRPLGKLEDMKVSDLKIELKRRNLPVSGSKPQLIERLKPYTETSSTSLTGNSNGPMITHMGHILMDTPGPLTSDDSSSHAKSPDSPIKDEPHSPRIDSPHNSEHDDPASPPEQRKRIEELQQALYISQQQLQKIRQTQPATVRAEKLVLQHHLQNKMQQQQLALHLQQLQHLQQQQQQHQQQQKQNQRLQNQQQQQQQQHAAFQQLNAKASLAAFLQSQPNSTTILDSATLTTINNKKNQVKNNNNNSNNIINNNINNNSSNNNNNSNNNSNTTVQLPAAIVLNLSKPTKINGSLLGALVAQAQQQQQQQQQRPVSTTITSIEDKSSPPQYDDAAKLLKVKIEPVQKNHIKSQVVDDVLEILIKNGELPPSAAQDPATPTTPNRQLQQNLVFSAAADSATQNLVFTAASPISPMAMDVSQSGCPSSPASSSPPVPPPLPLATFSVQLPSALHQHGQHQDEIPSFTADLLNSNPELDTAMLLSPQSVQQGSPDPQPPQEVTSSDNTNLDLKELGLDLETLDTMDFGQLDCDLGVKIEAPQEFMDLGDMPMDMDDPDWLDSLMPQSPPPLQQTTINQSNNNHNNSSPVCTQSTVSDLYDPLLANSQDPFDLFNMEDSDFKMSSDLSLTWDKLDFAT
ncbi:myocardin-related transcription factor A-like isoform X2 [Microplitis mediator]|uniref:myocardin-related transcription factor A-like isoform X2 n=1 Tax=Microplitis mediator TaxID=375433 RepID=UPI0025551506|nr:myocardin-related transcription factor A-like isoform X2 [Microplitis mediator]